MIDRRNFLKAIVLGAAIAFPLSRLQLIKEKLNHTKAEVRMEAWEGSEYIQGGSGDISFIEECLELYAKVHPNMVITNLRYYS